MHINVCVCINLPRFSFCLVSKDGKKKKKDNQTYIFVSVRFQKSLGESRLSYLLVYIVLGDTLRDNLLWMEF
jgi:hypothetical protein